VEAGEAGRSTIYAMAILLVFVIVLGIYIPQPFYEMLMKVVDVVR